MSDLVVVHDMKAGSAVKFKLSTIKQEKLGMNRRDDKYGLTGAPLCQRPGFFHNIDVAHLALSC